MGLGRWIVLGGGLGVMLRGPPQQLTGTWGKKEPGRKSPGGLKMGTKKRVWFKGEGSQIPLETQNIPLKRQWGDGRECIVEEGEFFGDKIKKKGAPSELARSKSEKTRTAIARPQA